MFLTLSAGTSAAPPVPKRHPASHQVPALDQLRNLLRHKYTLLKIIYSTVSAEQVRPGKGMNHPMFTSPLAQPPRGRDHWQQQQGWPPNQLCPPPCLPTLGPTPTPAEGPIGGVILARCHRELLLVLALRNPRILLNLGLQKLPVLQAALPGCSPSFTPQLVKLCC